MSNPIYIGSDKRLQQLFQNGGGGGGGTTVVANPSGEATDELEKLQVGQTIYSIPEGGGGGTPIPWTFVGDATGSVAIDVSGVWTDADEFCVAVFCDGDSANMLVTTIAKSSIPSSNGRFGLGGDPNIALVEASPTQIKLTYAKWSSVVTSTTVTKVYYRKKITGGGGGSSTLAGLSDVNLSSPTDGQVLTYNNGDWVNANGGGSGGSGGTVYMNTMYSTTEKKVGYWTDGKPLYQKVIECGAGPNNAVKTVAHGISNIETIIPLIALGKGSTYTLPIPYTDSAVNTQISLFVDSTNINLWSGSDRSSYMVRVILQYTKTTDTADPHPQNGGVIYLPEIYSEEERQVGFWEDGKPLYQKTYAGLSLDCPTANTWYNTNILLGDIDVITSAELIDDNRQYIAGVVGTMSERTYLGVYLSISGRTITTITIQYTKTTDTAEPHPPYGSTLYLPTMYSERERQIGYWEDGKPLYQKTITFSTAISGVQTINHGISDLDTVVEVKGAVHDSHETDPSWIPDPRIAQDGNNIGISNVYPTFITIYVPTVFGSRIHKGHITIQYTKTTDTADVNPQAGGAIYLPQIYSNIEKQIGVWKDGKPLYQKTIELSSELTISNVDWTSIGITASSLNIDKYVDVFAQNTVGTCWRAVNAATINGYISLTSWRNGDMIAVKNVTIQYTKTTDTSGSSPWTPSGGQSAHYSTNEQVVGTWIDGKTLYEKTYNFTAGSSGVYNSYDLGLSESSIDTIFLQTGYVRNDTSSYKSCVYLSAYTSSPGYEQIGGGLATTNGTWQFYYRLGNDVAGGDVTLTIRYTKSS